MGQIDSSGRSLADTEYFVSHPAAKAGDFGIKSLFFFPLDGTLATIFDRAT